MKNNRSKKLRALLNHETKLIAEGLSIKTTAEKLKKIKKRLININNEIQKNKP